MPVNASVILSSILLGTSVYTDLKHRVIPNRLTLPACLAGMGYHVWRTGISDGLLFSIAGFAAGFAVLLVPFLLGGMGGGDVKLVAAAGSWIGTAAVLHLVLYGAVVGGLIAAWMIYKRSGIRGIKEVFLGLFLDILGRQRPRVDSGNPRLPYSLPLAIGFVAYLMIGRII